MKLTSKMLAFAAIVLMPISAQASIYNFNITYDGVSQSLDGGSDAMTGTNLGVGDGFVLDLHAAGNDYWQVTNGAAWNSSIYASLLVDPSDDRTGDITTTFYQDGVQVHQDIDLGQVQSFIHVGAQETTLTDGLMFDQIVVQYDLTDHAGVTEIQTDDVFWSFIGDTNRAIYIRNTIPEPTALAVWSLGLVGLVGFRRRKR